MTHEWESMPEETVLDFWKRQLTIHAEKRLAQYYTRLEDGTETYKTLTYEQFDRITTNLACESKPMFKDNTYIGYINNHSIDYLITYVSFLKMNSILVCLSTKNSAAANASLLQSVNTTTLLAVPSYSTMAHDTSAILRNGRVTIVNPYDIDAMINKPLNSDAEEILRITTQKSIYDTTLILHSSGSTGNPKIIYLDSRVFLHSRGMLKVSEKDCGFNVLGDQPNILFYYMPLFHMSGQIFITNAIFTGSNVVFMEPKVSCVKRIFTAMKDTKCDIALLPPLIMKQLLYHADEINDWSVLQNLKVIAHGGAILKKETEETYREKHINICSFYAGTEMGIVLTENFALNGPNKHYLKPLSTMKQYCLWEDYAPDPRLKQLIIRHDCPTLSISVKRRENGNYETNDLFLEDKLNPGHYTYVSRTEDTLVLNTASKVNPLPIEIAIRECPIINECLVFGMGYPCIGVLVKLSEDAHLKYSVDEIQDIVYSAVDKANTFALEYTVIKKSMIKILSANETFPMTDKYTVKRKLGYIQYKNTIEALYEQPSV
ncbi:hypothetical protein BDF14DRAFT_1955817 [Spinellus fusiger]|nr:hypothetical protein BDF14DRAFT_1955817 [Spinellus fusiger]